MYTKSNCAWVILHDDLSICLKITRVKPGRKPEYSSALNLVQAIETRGLHIFFSVWRRNYAHRKSEAWPSPSRSTVTMTSEIAQDLTLVAFLHYFPAVTHQPQETSEL